MRHTKQTVSDLFDLGHALHNALHRDINWTVGAEGPEHARVVTAGGDELRMRMIAATRALEAEDAPVGAAFAEVALHLAYSDALQPIAGE